MERVCHSVTVPPTPTNTAIIRMVRYFYYASIISLSLDTTFWYVFDTGGAISKFIAILW